MFQVNSNGLRVSVISPSVHPSAAEMRRSSDFELSASASPPDTVDGGVGASTRGNQENRSEEEEGEEEEDEGDDDEEEKAGGTLFLAELDDSATLITMLQALPNFSRDRVS